MTKLKHSEEAYKLYELYIKIGREKFKQQFTAKQYRAYLSMFRPYVKEYNTKRQHATYKIEYNGKCQSLNKWCQELNVSKWSAYALLKQGKSFQNIFDCLKATSRSDHSESPRNGQK